MGRAYDDVIALKKSRNEERQRRRLLVLDGAVHSVDADVGANGGVVSGDALHGGATDAPDIASSSTSLLVLDGSISDLSPSVDAIESFISFLDSSSFPYPVATHSLVDFETDLFPLSECFALKAFSPPFSRPFNLSKPPSSYTEAIARPDASIWHAAMDRERESLANMGAFEEVDLPKGERAVGLKWVYDIKTDANGDRIPGKEKARLVAQGFSQRPGQYDETYVPVAKLASV
jgi:Reverse transcriptase (RNA-dependent DNA polymerase)